MNRPSARSGGEILIQQLRVHGVDTVFCVPGESYLAAIDALYDHHQAMRLIVCRQEGGAAYMAEAYGKLTGRPGVCFVTRGPGATNASVGVHTAFQDSTPLILFVGQVGTDVVEREAFQEIDFRRMYGQMAKWVAQIDDPARIPEFVSRAFYTACAGRPGPVVLALPEDMLVERAEVADVMPYQVVRPAPPPASMVALHQRLVQAERPFLLLGGGGWDAAACADIQAFAESYRLPVGCAFRCQDLFDNGHPQYAGDVGIGINPKLGARVRQADLLLVVGARLGEMTTGGYSLLQPPVLTQPLVHVHASAEELGRVYQPALAINSGMAEFAAAARQLPGIQTPRWAETSGAAHQDYLAYSAPLPIPGALQLGEIMAYLREMLPADAILCNGAGNYTGFLHRYYRYRPWRTQLAPTNGSMGYSVPAAIAAKLAAPNRTVVSFSGDGCYLMNGQELATAVQYGVAVLFIVVNNGMYGTIRMHQEKAYPARVIGTHLRNPDFAALARAYGAHGEIVETTAEFAPALERALASGGPALLELRIDPQAITTSATLDGLRAQALAGRAA
jgi:acetolactate synthase-1/2/3 large subunit